MTGLVWISCFGCLGLPDSSPTSFADPGSPHQGHKQLLYTDTKMGDVPQEFREIFLLGGINGNLGVIRCVPIE